MKEDVINFRGTILEAFPNARFKVKLGTDYELNCTISGKIRKHNIRILRGDEVEVEMSPYDITFGRITYR